YKNYFGSKSWYRLNPNFSENLFNAVEKENMKRIQNYEKRKGWR
ncbi:MAG: YARHG domain-containing protein, partial [Holosporales bacterium]|nr:YARHG domain-containing protein [Holosporales bacterium]